jgi:hypothetical protein
MLFKSDVPMSHRVAFFLAGMITIGPMQRMMRGVGLEALDFFPAAIAGASSFTSGDNAKP